MQKKQYVLQKNSKEMAFLGGAGLSGQLGNHLMQLGVDYGEKGADNADIALVSGQFRLAGEFTEFMCPDIG